MKMMEIQQQLLQQLPPQYVLEVMEVVVVDVEMVDISITTLLTAAIRTSLTPSASRVDLILWDAGITSLLCRLQVKTLPDATPPKGEIHPSRQIVLNQLCDFDVL